MLIDPEYLLKEYETSVSEDGETIINGYYMIEKTNTTLFFPQIINKKSGVMYIDDVHIGNEGNAYKSATSYNIPDGTTTITGNINYNSTFNFILQGNIIPEFAQQYYESDIPNWSTTHKIQGLFGWSGNEAKSATDTLVDADVGAISVALYEDFYNYSFKMNIKIYGIPKSLVLDKLGKKIGNKKYLDFEKKIIQKGCESCDLLLDKEINTTDVYYIDFNDLNKETYMNYIIECEIGDIPKYYSCLLYAAGAYNITDFNEYEAWKKEHAKQMLNN